MRIQGKRLSQQARTKLNAVLLDWLNANKDQIDECCLIAELFGKARWNDRTLTRLRVLMRGLLNELRVMHRDMPGTCEIRTREEVREYWPGLGGWERLSTTVKAAFVGWDHSMIITKEKLEQAKESAR